MTGNWFKLICGASYQDIPAIRSLALAYALAGADCIDVAADLAVITAAREGLTVAKTLTSEAQQRGFNPNPNPLLMVSLNDGEDPHFRKAHFDPQSCPPDCPRPCEAVCPAEAIALSGVVEHRCYGCGRCVPTCPLGLIITRSHIAPYTLITSAIESKEVNALEIHTKTGHEAEFQQLWDAIAPWYGQLTVLAISFPDHPHLIDYLHAIYDLISPLSCPLIWQTDGRPMSGDLGKGTTYPALRLAQKVLGAGLPGYIQLAGGTNGYTVSKLRDAGLLTQVAGVAYGSYGRSLIHPLLPPSLIRLEDSPQSLWKAVSQAASLVSQLKQ